MSGVGLLIASLATVSNADLVQRIDWEADEGCPSQAAVVEATASFLGRRLAEFPRTVIAQAQVEASTGGYRLRLMIEVDGVEEHHELPGLSCEQLGWDAALLIASAIDPFALGPREPPGRQLLLMPVVVQRPSSRPQPARVVTAPPRQISSAAEPPPPDVDRLEPSGPLDIAAAPSMQTRTRAAAGSLAVAGTTFVGLFPQIGGGVEIEGGLDVGLFRWQASAAGWFGGSFRASGTDVGGDLWAASGSTGACVVPRVRRVRFASCAVVGAGAITAIPVNTTAQGSLARPWAHAGADLRVAWSPRPRVGLSFGLAVLPALARPAWSTSSPDASFRIPPVTGLLRLGIELRELGAG